VINVEIFMLNVIGLLPLLFQSTYFTTIYNMYTSIYITVKLILLKL